MFVSLINFSLTNSHVVTIFLTIFLGLPVPRPYTSLEFRLCDIFTCIKGPILVFVWNDLHLAPSDIWQIKFLQKHNGSEDIHSGLFPNRIPDFTFTHRLLEMKDKFYCMTLPGLFKGEKETKMFTTLLK